MCQASHIYYILIIQKIAFLIAHTVLRSSPSHCVQVWREREVCARVRVWVRACDIMCLRVWTFESTYASLLDTVHLG